MRVPGRLEGAPADVERVLGRRLDGRVRPRDDHLVEARRERALLGEQVDVRAREAGELRDRRPQPGDEAAQLGPRHQPPHLLEHRQPGPQRLGALAHAGQRLAGEGAQMRKRRVERLEGRLALGEEVGQALDRLSERRVLGRERAGHPAQVRDQVAERLRVSAQAAEDPAEAADHAAQVAAVRAELRLRDLGRELVGGRRGAEQLAQALGAAVADQRVSELVEERLQVACGRRSAAWSAPRRAGRSGRSGRGRRCGRRRLRAALGLPGCRSTK